MSRGNFVRWAAEATIPSDMVKSRLEKNVI